MADQTAAPAHQEDRSMEAGEAQAFQSAPVASPPAEVAPVEEPPSASESAATPVTTTSGEQGSVDVQVFLPNTSETSAPSEPADDFFEPTVSDLQRHQASIAGRSQQLNDSPLMTSKHREAEQAAKEKAKATKWPTATIRVKFSDGTHIQSAFPSTSPIQPVYEFVRSALTPDAAARPFILSQPPHTIFPERPLPPSLTAKKPINPKMKAHVITPSNYGPVRGASTRSGTGGKESLSDLGLVPQSVLIVRWEAAEMNASTYPAPIKEELRAKAAPLPAAQPRDAPQPPASSSAQKKPGAGTGNTGEAKMPKWLAKGLLKKK